MENDCELRIIKDSGEMTVEKMEIGGEVDKYVFSKDGSVVRKLSGGFPIYNFYNILEPKGGDIICPQCKEERNERTMIQVNDDYSICGRCYEVLEFLEGDKDLV